MSQGRSDNLQAQKYFGGNNNALSIASTASSGLNLAPFEGLTADQVAFVSSIIRRVPSSVTTFVPVFKAYQDEFEVRGLNPTDDQFYYNLLLKLGLIRAENWQQRWNKILENLNYEEILPSSPQLPAPAASTNRDPSTRRPAFEEDDVFTLHSHDESLNDATPPSYQSRRAKLPEPAQFAHDYLSEDEPVRHPPSSRRASSTLIKKAIPRRISSGVTSGMQTPRPRETSSPTNTVPPSYRTLPQTTLSKQDREVLDSDRIRDDAETWRIIEMERDADLFRRDSLLSRCFDVWYKNLKWVEVCSLSVSRLHSGFSQILTSII
jgi:protein SFI1